MMLRPGVSAQMALFLGSEARFVHREHAGPDGDGFVVVELNPGESNSYCLYLDRAPTVDRLIDVLRAARDDLADVGERIPGQGELFEPASTVAA